MVKMISRLFSKCVKNHKLLWTQQWPNLLESCSCMCSRTASSNLKPENPDLYQYLYSKILACGPISVAEYMKEILTHPIRGYYMERDVFGEKGDFITSPEISQLFGEMIAIWIVHEYRKISREPFQLVELGPGRGTLIKDILSVFNQLKITNTSVHLVEISPALSKIQAENLCIDFNDNNPVKNDVQSNAGTYYKKGVTNNGVNVYWYYSVNDVPRKFSVFLAHEFFDALPIHKFQKLGSEWNEVLVDIVETGIEEKFRYVLAKTPTCALYTSGQGTNDHLEVSPQSIAIIDYVSQFLKECGGFAIIFDYGHQGEQTDTFRAFRKHKLHDPLSQPGSADLTADVDFSMLKEIAEKDNRVLTLGPVTQRSFLKNLGIDVRLMKLLQSTTKEQRQNLESGYHMIMDEDKMGVRFKVFSIFPSVLKEYFQKLPVAGFQGESDPKL